MSTFKVITFGMVNDYPVYYNRRKIGGVGRMEMLK